jgi:hypothetical protein
MDIMKSNGKNEPSLCSKKNAEVLKFPIALFSSQSNDFFTFHSFRHWYTIHEREGEKKKERRKGRNGGKRKEGNGCKYT